jgi:molybdopterin synthase catalytic subunit
MPVRIQTEDFDIGKEIDDLRGANAKVGAVASFIGTVRERNEVSGDATQVVALTLEHYPGMTEAALDDICSQAASRFRIIDTLVVHRVGPLLPLDQIVLVVVTSEHRGEAFAACEFVMDYLKTEAPFWKKESTPDGSRWVEARESDTSAAKRWDKDQ